MAARAGLLLLAILTVLAMAITATAAADSTSSYTFKYNVDVDAVLSNRRLVNNYVQCLLGKKRCPPEGSELKRMLPEAISTRCAKCTVGQKKVAIRVIQRLRTEYPGEWLELQRHWDPTGVNIKTFERSLLRYSLSRE